MMCYLKIIFNFAEWMGKTWFCEVSNCNSLVKYFYNNGNNYENIPFKMFDKELFFWNWYIYCIQLQKVFSQFSS